MLKDILYVSGKPGLYKMVSQGKNLMVIESLSDSKRIPVFSSDKIVYLKDIAIFTENGEIPLSEVFEKIKTKENGAKCAVDAKSGNKKLVQYLEEILPDYDRERVYPSDIRKLINWYNILVDAKLTDFAASETEIDDKVETVSDKTEEISSEK
jgi:hypothetical protein